MAAQLRTGRTTGSCATAAAMAGTVFLLTGGRPDAIYVPLPPGGTLTVPVERYEPGNNTVRVTVIKDGGDDPDATHGCEIQAVVTLDRKSPGALSVAVDGGRGVGRATLPGLPVAVGCAAINPEPLKQIEEGVRMAARGMETGRISVLVEVPEGETIAGKTMNARLGIVGGISILGTQGIVQPYSHESWKATIDEGLDVARAQGLTSAVFTTGRRSERFFLKANPGTPPLACIQAADFFAHAMRAAAERGFGRVTWSVFFGKLVKQAQGLEYTHAGTHAVDFNRLADRCAEAGVDGLLLPEIRHANTAVQVLNMLNDPPIRRQLISLLADSGQKAAEAFSGGLVQVDYTVFDFEGTRLK
jgi:cobalt-precorrin-5B (C1)-methyltransferase